MTIIKDNAAKLAEFMATENIQLDDASLVLAHLDRQGKVGDENANFMFKFKCHAWDGAVALRKAIDKVFGFSFGESTFSFFKGEELPQMIEIETGTGPEDRVTVPWGQLSLPGVDGTITPAMNGDEFYISCSVKRKHEDQVKALAVEMERILREESIYRGKAVRLVLKPQMFEEDLLTPEFLRLAGLDASRLVLNQSVRDDIEINLFTPIDRRQAVKDAGIEWRRGVLLTGGFGTGKTLTAAITAAKAEAAGITFAICDANSLTQALRFGRDYTPAIVFCEDVDGSLIARRTAEVNLMLNELDGVTSKDVDIMVVLTTNNVEDITKAALRPGRCDAVIEFELPNAQTTEALIRAYAGDALPADVDISGPAQALRGNSPAIIAEATKRAKLAAVRVGAKLITAELLNVAVHTMRRQIELLNQPYVPKPGALEAAADVIGVYLHQALMTAGHHPEVQKAAEAIKNGKEGEVAAPWLKV